MTPQIGASGLGRFPQLLQQQFKHGVVSHPAPARPRLIGAAAMTIDQVTAPLTSPFRERPIHRSSGSTAKIS